MLAFVLVANGENKMAGKLGWAGLGCAADHFLSPSGWLTGNVGRGKKIKQSDHRAISLQWGNISIFGPEITLIVVHTPAAANQTHCFRTVTASFKKKSIILLHLAFCILQPTRLLWYNKKMSSSMSLRTPWWIGRKQRCSDWDKKRANTAGMGKRKTTGVCLSDCWPQKRSMSIIILGIRGFRGTWRKDNEGEFKVLWLSTMGEEGRM